MEVDHGVRSWVLHTKGHGFLCKLGEITMEPNEGNGGGFVELGGRSSKSSRNG